MYARPETRQRLHLPLVSCALACLCAIIVTVLSVRQLHEYDIRETPELCHTTGRLTENRERAVPFWRWHSSSLLLYVYDQLPGMPKACQSPLY